MDRTVHADPHPDTRPETPATVARYIHDWTDRGLLDSTTADRLLDDLHAHAGAPQGRTPTGTGSLDRLIEAAKTLAFESFGYLGAALTIGAVFVLLDVPTWSGSVHVGFLALIAVVAVWGTFALTPPSSGTTRRLAAVTGAVAVAATAGALVLALEPDCVTWTPSGDEVACTFAQEYLLPLVMVLPILAVAVVVYGRHRHLLTHVALGASTVAAVIVTGQLLATGSGLADDPESIIIGLLLAVVAVLWTWGAETDQLVPAWLGTFGSGITLFAAIAMVTEYDPLFGSDPSPTILTMLVVAVAYVLAGILLRRVRLVIVGSVALLFAVPATLTEVLGLSGTATATLLLPVGLALTVWAVTAGRKQLAEMTGDAQGQRPNGRRSQ